MTNETNETNETTETVGDDEPAMVTKTLMCHTENCENAGIAIELEMPETIDAFACGACGQPITDVT